MTDTATDHAHLHKKVVDVLFEQNVTVKMNVLCAVLASLTNGLSKVYGPPYTVEWVTEEVIKKYRYAVETAVSTGFTGGVELDERYTTPVFVEAFRMVTGADPTPINITRALKDPELKQEIEETMLVIEETREDEKEEDDL
jgi:hypothetical protein